MCGIFVAFNLSRETRSASDLMRAVRVATHRGPDSVGHYDDRFCFLGATRLSIVGIEPNGDQPFHFQNLVMVFNGEIFNYIELRNKLAGVGYVFSTRSDTEVAIKAYHAWGKDCFGKFNGMWALAIYDRDTRTLTISRDRFGQKPLFLMRRGGTVYCASEVQQLVPLSDAEADYGAIEIFLKEGMYGCQGRTFFRAIKEYPKAHYSVVDQWGKFVTSRYWEYCNAPRTTTAKSSDFDEFESLLVDAVKVRLRSDVPYCVLLSGGVDSTLVAAYARRLAGPGKVIPAFTYSSAHGHDEAPYARQVADKLAMPLAVCVQTQVPTEYRDRLKRLVRHMGRGHSSPAIVSVDYLYELASKSGLKVALDGQGSDELLAGYYDSFVPAIGRFIVQGRFGQAAASLSEIRKYGLASCFILYLRQTLPPKARMLGRWLYGYERFFQRHESRSRTDKRSEIGSVQQRFGGLNGYLIKQHDEILTDLLFYGDIAAMRHGVENRSPFLDHRLVEFALSRSNKMKVWNGRNKYALRILSAYREFDDVLNRMKVGFASPIKPETMSLMNEELLGSPVLSWPMFSKKLPEFINRGGLRLAKFEPLLFRLYQVHLWNEVFSATSRAWEGASDTASVEVVAGGGVG